MTSRKRNEFLDDPASDEDAGDAYTSDEDERGRGGIGGRASKRQRVEAQDDDNDVSLDELSDDDGVDNVATTILRGKDFKAGTDILPKALVAAEGEDQEDDEDDAFHDAQDISSLSHGPDTKADLPKSVAKAEKAARKSGVIYISRVPPFMKPHTLKHFLSPHAPKGIGRLFLTPEDHAAYLARKKNGGNKKKSFTDGWVEFVSKTDAKIAAQTLNGNIIGGKKGGYYHDDLWNMKYLKGFKWSHLTEQISAENAEREARMREEIRRTKKENRAFLEDVERGKMLETMESKGKAKGQSKEGERPAREFKQAKVQKQKGQVDASGKPDVHRALSMIF